MLHDRVFRSKVRLTFCTERILLLIMSSRRTENQTTCTEIVVCLCDFVYRIHSFRVVTPETVHSNFAQGWKSVYSLFT